MEEENGRPDAALRVLLKGLTLCRSHDSLLPKIVKLLERLRKFDHIRHILSRLKYESIDRTWKLLLEGCLFEARDGNSKVSRRIFKYLMKHVHWHGPIYFEAFRLEEREGREKLAEQIARSGLSELKHYGPLWFGLMRMLERQDIRNEECLWIRGQTPELRLLALESKEAVKFISRELTWRVYFERFQAEERAAEISALGLYHISTGRSLASCRNEMLNKCRQSLAQSLLLCPSSPNNLRWRLYLVGARMELGVDNITAARDLLKRAYKEVPSKSKAAVIIEYCRLEEYLGNTDVARHILLQARNEMSHDWKGYLESVLLEARAGRLAEAMDAAKIAVREHPGTGRLWALRIQLHHRAECAPQRPPLSVKRDVICNAIAEVPKSGEVWCEYARCLLNPFQLHAFDLGQAVKALNFAINFTPQYGDTFVEYLRIEMLCDMILPQVCTAIGLNFHGWAAMFLASDEESDLHSRITPDGALKLVPLNHSQVEEAIRAIHHLEYEFDDCSPRHQYPCLLKR